VLLGKGLKITDGTSHNSNQLARPALPQLERLRRSVRIILHPVLGFLPNTCRDFLNHGDGRRYIPADRIRQDVSVFPYGFLSSSI
jgi:hypothetical protein